MHSHKYRLLEQSENAEALRCLIDHGTKNISLALSLSHLDVTLLSLNARSVFGIRRAMQHSSSWIMVAILSTLELNYLTGFHSRGMN